MSSFLDTNINAITLPSVKFNTFFFVSILGFDRVLSVLCLMIL